MFYVIRGLSDDVSSIYSMSMMSSMISVRKSPNQGPIPSRIETGREAAAVRCAVRRCSGLSHWHLGYSLLAHCCVLLRLLGHEYVQVVVPIALVASCQNPHSYKRYSEDRLGPMLSHPIGNTIRPRTTSLAQQLPSPSHLRNLMLQHLSVILRWPRSPLRSCPLMVIRTEGQR